MIEITLSIPLTKKVPTLINSLEAIMKQVKIKKVKNISNYHLMTENNENVLQLEGINLQAIWKKRNYFEVNEIASNDVSLLGEVFGIEAGRNAWINEVQTVFSHYGIKVDYRHAYLVADHMTFSG